MGWSAPEQFNLDSRVSPAADVYAASAVVVWALTLVEPCEVRHEESKAFADSTLSWTAHWQDGLQRSLAFDPSRRPADIEQWQAALATRAPRPVRLTDPDAVTELPSPSRSQRWHKRWASRFAVASAIPVVALASVAVARWPVTADDTPTPATSSTAVAAGQPISEADAGAAVGERAAADDAEPAGSDNSGGEDSDAPLSDLAEGDSDNARAGAEGAGGTGDEDDAGNTFVDPGETEDDEEGGEEISGPQATPPDDPPTSPPEGEDDAPAPDPALETPEPNSPPLEPEPEPEPGPDSEPPVALEFDYSIDSGDFRHRSRPETGGDWGEWVTIPSESGARLQGNLLTIESGGYLFGHAIGTDGRLHYSSRNLTTGTWKSVLTNNSKPTTGANLVGSPAAGLTEGYMMVFALGDDGHMYYRYRHEDPAGWGVWKTRGAPDGVTLVGIPTVEVGNGRLTVKARASDGLTYYRYRVEGTRGDWSDEWLVES